MQATLRRATRALAALCFLAMGLAAAADDPESAEAERREAFRAGMERIVAGFNEGWYEPFVEAIDREAMVARIFGLRLIDQRVKRSFTEGLDYSWDDFVAAYIPRDKESQVEATLLGVESRGDRGRAVVRFDLPKLQFGYQEYDLKLRDKGSLEVVDWTDYGKGYVFSQNVGETLVASAPSSPALRKLLDFNAADRDLFPLRELLKSAAQGDFDRYLEILPTLSEKFARQRIVIETTVQLARDRRKRRPMLAGLEKMAQYYPDEPRYGLMLLDHYFPRKMYDEATAVLERVYRRIGFPDAAMEARLSAARLAAGDGDGALAHAARALQLDKELQLAWWSALNARVMSGDFATAVEALAVLEDEYGYTLDAATLGRDPDYRALLASPEYTAWRAGR